MYLASKEKQAIEETVTCPECGSNHLSKDYSRAELVCQDCGLVIDEDLIDHGPEWRAFDSEQREKRARTGSPMTYMIHDKGLSTMISWKNRDSYGKSIPTRNRAQLFRLRKWQRRIRISNATERNLATALSSLDRMASGMNLPRTVRETACRQCHVPRTLDEISQIANMSRKEIGRNYRYVSRELGLKLLPTTPQDYISRFCSELKLSSDVQGKVMEILKEAADAELTSGRGPTGIAAASIYVASILCGERRTQREVSEVAGVTEVTIRNRYKELAEKLSSLTTTASFFVHLIFTTDDFVPHIHL